MSTEVTDKKAAAGSPNPEWPEGFLEKTELAQRSYVESALLQVIVQDKTLLPIENAELFRAASYERALAETIRTIDSASELEDARSSFQSQMLQAKQLRDSLQAARTNLK